MSIFPFLDFEAEEQDLPEVEEEIFKEYAWDFSKNDFIIVDGNFVIVQGLEAVKIWAYKALTTERFRYTAYSWNYGNELEQLLGHEYSAELIQSEAQRYIEETLLINPYIIGISDLVVSLDESCLNISCSLNTQYGEAELNV